MRLLIPESGGRIGLVERPATARFLRGTAGFVTLLVEDGTTRHDGGLDVSVAAARPTLGTIRHSITNHRIAARVERAPAAIVNSGATIRWLTPESVEEQLISNLDRKAWRLFSERSGG